MYTCFIPERSQAKEISGLHLCHKLAVLSVPDLFHINFSAFAEIQKAFQMPTCVSFHEDTTNSRTVVELVSWDRPGLLCRVGQAFMECGVQLHNAKIMTIGARAEDVFFVTDRENRPLNDSRKYMALRETLVAQLDSGED